MSGAVIYKGSPCPHGHPGFRYQSTRRCVDCTRQQRREERSGARKVRDINAELFRMNYLAVYAPDVFDAEGWKRAGAPRYEEV